MHHVEPLEMEIAKIMLATDAQLLGAGGCSPPFVGKSLATELGGDHQIARVRVKGLEDEAVRDMGTVVPSGIDEVDAEVHRAAEEPLRALGIVGLPPHVFAGEAHGSVAEALNFEVAEANG